MNVPINLQFNIKNLIGLWDLNKFLALLKESNKIVDECQLIMSGGTRL
jgi:hypothetical protein